MSGHTAVSYAATDCEVGALFSYLKTEKSLEVSLT